MNVFSNILTKRLKHGLVDKRAIKKRPGKAVLISSSELSQNCTEKQIIPFKTTVNWHFNDI